MKTKKLYWIVTAIFAAFMTFSAIPNIVVTEESVVFMTALGYPKYFIPFIGIAKLLGCFGIVLPINARIKEWAYAGLFYDLIGATYSQLANSGFQSGILFMALPIGVGVVSYICYQQIKPSAQHAF